MYSGQTNQPLLAGLLLILTIFLPACSETSTVAPEEQDAEMATIERRGGEDPAEGVHTVDPVEVFAAIIRRVITQDDTAGGILQPPTVYVVSHTDDSVGDPGIERSEPIQLAEETRQGITEALTDLPTTIEWVPSFEAVRLDPDTGEVVGGGIIVTLGNLHPQPDGTLLVSASSYFANMGAGGRTYILQQENGEWVIMGTTGVEWMS